MLFRFSCKTNQGLYLNFKILAANLLILSLLTDLLDKIIKLQLIAYILNLSDKLL